MIFDLNIRIMANTWEVESRSLGFHERATPLCMSTVIRGREMFLAIGEPKMRFENDPDFRSQESTGKLRFFDPFAVNTFEPKNAVQVINFYIRKAHHSYQGHLNPLAVLFTQYFWDKCHLLLDIADYGSLPQLARAALEEELDHISMLKNWKIETTEPRGGG
jgi:hypothetical protein